MSNKYGDIDKQKGQGSEGGTMITAEQMEDTLAECRVFQRIEGELPENAEFRNLTCDSRGVLPGDVFICKGAAFRPEYLIQAAQKGAAAYVSESVPLQCPAIPGFIVSDIRKAMAALAALFLGYRPEEMELIGITGTKGKTTTAWYLKAMLDLWMKGQERPETALLSTIQNCDGKRWEDSDMTTPEPVELHSFLKRTRENGAPFVTMEVSSQALKYKRVRGLRFRTGVFLNISEDHISPLEHADFEDYFHSKLSMFRQCETACVNLDSDCAKQVLDAARKAKQTVTFGQSPGADIRYGNIRTSQDGSWFTVSCNAFSEQFHLAMKGRFNIENAVAAIAAAQSCGVPVCCMKQALAQTEVPGRMETYQTGDGKICGIVDFAHNRLSFERLFDTAFSEYGAYKKIITIFGCPGGKALNRRRELGMIAGLFSDHVIVTSDDPGMEEQTDIAHEVSRSIEMTGCSYECVEERKAAVGRAFEKAAQYKERVLILLLGRGCEKYQKIKDGRIEYPEDAVLMREAVRKYGGFTFQRKCIMMEAS